MTKCKLCQEEIKGPMMGCSKGCLCQKCMQNMIFAETQPMQSHDNVFWTIAETYFRLAKGEDVSFESVWNEKENLKLVYFTELLPTFLGELKGDKKK